MNLENVVVEGSGLTTKTDGIRRLKTWSKLVQFYLGSEIYHFIPARDEQIFYYSLAFRAFGLSNEISLPKQ